MRVTENVFHNGNAAFFGVAVLFRVYFTDNCKIFSFVVFTEHSYLRLQNGKSL